ncbi:unnamed protein product [Podospora anserina S mat+]|uniref:Podospora anserina S mat+ genomic DNA chromosome 4, supercontig 4 n=1 Tax=Podospora anserina (strain S / ATCC MYA-4624 / DSM 980 / FGSC 10383) TaxID=515849 RepID=B2AQ92_PODAN|nr:unnamed protein product [Podospora anserina S mat+]CDP28774.1 Putative protein of unknown function [Podospora anserina S mat+]
MERTPTRTSFIWEQAC